MKTGWLNYGGNISSTIGFYTTGKGTHNAPERDVTTFEIAGRNGDFFVDNGRFRNIQVTYPCFAMNFSSKEQSIRNAFGYPRNDYAVLMDSYDDTHFRLARPVGGIEFDPVRGNAANFALSFDCDPRRFLTEGENPINILPPTRSVVFTEGKNISSSNNGIPTDRSDRSATLDGYAVNKGADYVISLTGSGSVGIFYYDAQDVYFAMEEGWNAVPATFTPPENAAFVRFSYNSGTAPTDAKLVCGVPVVFTSGKNINASGEIINNSGRSATLDGLSIVAETSYTISYSGSGGVGVFYYDVNDTFLSMETGWGTPPSRTFTTPENAAFVRFAYNNGTIPTNAILSCDATIATNPTPFASRPLFKITTPAQNDVLSVNGKSITFTSAYAGDVIIDCEKMDAYSGANNLNGIISLTDFPELTEGVNAVSWSGSGTCKLIPRWWEL